MPNVEIPVNLDFSLINILGDLQQTDCHAKIYLQKKGIHVTEGQCCPLMIIPRSGGHYI